MNLDSSIDFDLKRFFRWWGRELALWVPEKIRRAVSNRPGYVFLTVTDETILIKKLADSPKPIATEFEFNQQGLVRYHKLIDSDPEFENAKFILRLNANQAIHKILYLPLEAKENLKQVVAFEMDKFTPFTSEQVYFSIKLLEKGQNGQIKVLVVLTPRETMDTIYLQLNSAEIYPDVVDYEGAANNFAEDLEIYSLLPEWERPVKNKITQTMLWLTGFVLLLLTIAVMVFPIWHEAQSVKSLRKQIDLLKNETRLVQQQQLEIDEIIEETERLLSNKRNAPSLLELINSLSGLIKDDTWLTHLKFKNGLLQIQGQSPTAEVLISVLENSPLFSNARFVSPLTQDKKTGFERFQINVEVNVEGVDEYE